MTRIPVTISLSQDQLNDLDEIVNAYGVSKRSEAVHIMINKCKGKLKDIYQNQIDIKLMEVEQLKKKLIDEIQIEIQEKKQIHEQEKQELESNQKYEDFRQTKEFQKLLNDVGVYFNDRYPDHVKIKLLINSYPDILNKAGLTYNEFFELANIKHKDRWKSKKKGIVITG